MTGEGSSPDSQTLPLAIPVSDSYITLHTHRAMALTFNHTATEEICTETRL